MELNNESNEILPIPLPVVQKKWYQNKGYIISGSLVVLIFIIGLVYFLAKEKTPYVVVNSKADQALKTQTGTDKTVPKQIIGTNKNALTIFYTETGSNGQISYTFYWDNNGNAEEIFNIETDSYGYDRSPLLHSWSADGKKLVLAINYHRGDSSVASDVIVLVSDDKKVKMQDRFTVNSAVSSVIFSPDSKKIVYLYEDLSQKSIPIEGVDESGDPWYSYSALPVVLKERDEATKSENIISSSVEELIPLEGKKCPGKNTFSKSSIPQVLSMDGNKIFFLNTWNSSINCGISWYDTVLKTSGLVTVPVEYKSSNDTFFIYSYSSSRKSFVVYNEKNDTAVAYSNGSFHPLNFKVNPNRESLSWFDDQTIIFQTNEPSKLVLDSGDIVPKVDVIYKKLEVLSGKEIEIYRFTLVPAIKNELSPEQFKKVYPQNPEYYKLTVGTNIPKINSGNYQEVLLERLDRSSGQSWLNVELKNESIIKRPVGVSEEFIAIGSLSN